MLLFYIYIIYIYYIDSIIRSREFCISYTNTAVAFLSSPSNLSAQSVMVYCLFCTSAALSSCAGLEKGGALLAKHHYSLLIWFGKDRYSRYSRKRVKLQHKMMQILRDKGYSGLLSLISPLLLSPHNTKQEPTGGRVKETGCEGEGGSLERR